MEYAIPNNGSVIYRGNNEEDKKDRYLAKILLVKKKKIYNKKMAVCNGLVMFREFIQWKSLPVFCKLNKIFLAGNRSFS